VLVFRGSAYPHGARARRADVEIDHRAYRRHARHDDEFPLTASPFEARGCGCREVTSEGCQRGVVDRRTIRPVGLIAVHAIPAEKYKGERTPGLERARPSDHADGVAFVSAQGEPWARRCLGAGEGRSPRRRRCWLRYRLST